MSMGKSEGSGRSDPSSVWKGQAPYLTSLYKQGSKLIPGAQQMGQDILPYIQNMLSPEGFGETMSSAAAPMLQSIRDKSIQGMNLGGSRQGVAEAQVGQNVGAQYMQMLPQLFNLGMGAQGFAPLMMQKNLVGSPTVLGGGSSSSKSGWELGF